jgi:hypothetical protein
MNGRIGLIGVTAILVASCAAPGVAAPIPTASAIPSAAGSISTAVSPSPTASATGAGGTPCASAQLAGAITLWEGAAGSRIAHVTLTNLGAPCLLSERLKPQLLDGNGTLLVDGTPSGVAATMASGATLQTLVEVNNYCGAAPVAPVTIGLVLTGRDRFRLAPRTPNDATVPPCNGASLPARMEMHPWG